MKYRTVFLIPVCLLFAVFKGNAFNQGDTAKPLKQHNITTIYTEPAVAPFHQWQSQAWTVDTGIDKLQYYIPQYNLGNPGSPYFPIVFNPDFHPLGFYYGNNYFGPQIYNDSNIRYYNTRAPYAQVYYVTNPKIQQFVHFIFSMNTSKKLNFTLEFQRTRSDGVYINQNTNINQLTLTFNYHTKHYLLLADGIYGVYKVNQNGGVTNDTDIGSSLFTNRQTAPVNLQTARSTFLERSAHVKQYFFFGFDKGDSAHPAAPAMYVAHTFKLGSYSNIYSDPGPLNPLYYANASDTSSTYDSLHYTQLFNDISIGSAKRWALNVLRWEAGVSDQYTAFRGVGYRDSNFNNLIAHACIYDTGRVLYNLQAKEVVVGNENGDMQLSGCLGYLIDSARSVRVEGKYALQTPEFLQEIYFGNNLRWQNGFNKVNTTSISLIYNDVKWKLMLALQATQIQNYVYFDEFALPEQYTPAITVLSARLRKDFKLGKWHWTTDDVIQYVPDSLPLRLPLLVLENSLFYQNYVFHHHMLLKLGVDLYYNTAYKGYGYMPVTNQYILEDNEQLGNYLYVDPFVSFRVKTFRMFFRLENAAQGLLGSNYVYVQNYPMTDRVLRLGISWDFYN